MPEVPLKDKVDKTLAFLNAIANANDAAMVDDISHLDLSGGESH